MALYTLFEMLQRSTAGHSTIAFPLGNRTVWTASLKIGAAPVSGSLEVILETSPVPDDDHFTQLATFGPQSAVGKTDLATAALTIPAGAKWLRSRILTITGGEWSFEVTADGVFFDLNDQDDLNLLSKELRNFMDMTRLVKDAERDAVDLILQDRVTGRMEAWINAPDFLEAMKAEIAQQAEHLFHRSQMLRSKEPAQQVTAREMPLRHPDLGKRISDYRPQSKSVWLGRG